MYRRSVLPASFQCHSKKVMWHQILLQSSLCAEMYDTKSREAHTLLLFNRAEKFCPPPHSDFESLLNWWMVIKNKDNKVIQILSHQSDLWNNDFYPDLTVPRLIMLSRMGNHPSLRPVVGDVQPEQLNVRHLKNFRSLLYFPYSGTSPSMSANTKDNPRRGTLQCGPSHCLDSTIR